MLPPIIWMNLPFRLPPSLPVPYVNPCRSLRRKPVSAPRREFSQSTLLPAYFPSFHIASFFHFHKAVQQRGRSNRITTLGRGNSKNINENFSLFLPIHIRQLTLKNRIVVSPMCQYSSEDGYYNDWHLVHLGSFAIGGAALVFSEATAVTPEGRITVNCAGLWKDEQMEKLKTIAKFIHSTGTAFGIQLSHAGRKAAMNSPFLGKMYGLAEKDTATGWVPLAPSPIPYKEDTYYVPKEMTKSDIQEIIQAFVASTKRCLEIGVDVVEIHAAHGYLVHEFLSPISNKRTDEYGGDFAGRTRFLLELVKEVREVWPTEKPLFVRISASDWVNDEPSWTIQDSCELSHLLEKAGVDVVDCSSGGNSPKQVIDNVPGYQVPFSKIIRKYNFDNSLLTQTVGLLFDPVQNDRIISRGEADLITMGREFLRDPHWPLRAAKVLGQKVHWMPQYERGKEKIPEAMKSRKKPRWEDFEH